MSPGSPHEGSPLSLAGADGRGRMGGPGERDPIKQRLSLLFVFVSTTYMGTPKGKRSRQRVSCTEATVRRRIFGHYVKNETMEKKAQGLPKNEPNNQSSQAARKDRPRLEVCVLCCCANTKGPAREKKRTKRKDIIHQRNGRASHCFSLFFCFSELAPVLRSSPLNLNIKTEMT